MSALAVFMLAMRQLWCQFAVLPFNVDFSTLHFPVILISSVSTQLVYYNGSSDTQCIYIDIYLLLR